MTVLLAGTIRSNAVLALALAVLAGSPSPSAAAEPEKTARA